eukprot:scaffold30802_cov61-Phaeocystis_antarctica.AAC.3
MAHMLLYSANYTACCRSASLHAHKTPARASRWWLTMEAPNSSVTISLSQVLEEALTTSKVMTGRRLLDCGLSPGRRLGIFDVIVDGFKDVVIDPIVDGVNDEIIDPIAEAAKKAAEAAKKAAEAAKKLADEALAVVARNLLVCDLLRGFKVTWDTASKGLVDAAKATASAAAATATKLLDEAKAATRAVQNAADAAANLATVTLNQVKDAAEKAAATATKFIDDVGGAFHELGDDIKCATPPPAQGASPRGGGVSMAPHASRAAPWYPCATCRRVEPGATWQECL